MTPRDPALARAAAYAVDFRRRRRPLHPTATTGDLRRAFCRALNDQPRDPAAVLDELVAAAEPGLVGNTEEAFFAWVMGASDTTGVAADWLTSAWGQNAAIFQTSPAAAIAEEAVTAWLLDLLDLPRESSVGFVTGATMAGFTCLAAARSEVLRRDGHDVERRGLHGAPLVRIYVSDDTHVSNLAALRFLGFGEANIAPVPSDAQGLMDTKALAGAMAADAGPKIIVAQAGHINSGGFDGLEAMADLAERHGAWLHVDGAFGLWTRALDDQRPRTAGAERADSWSVDGHKWLQVPYDSGYAIVRHPTAHRRAMDMTASYLTNGPEDGRNPTEFNPELSRRARGFASWAILRTLGRQGVRDLIRSRIEIARHLAARLADVPGIEICNDVVCNQVALRFHATGATPDVLTEDMAARLNATGRAFVRTTVWKGRTVLRLSVTSGLTDADTCARLVGLVRDAWLAMRAERGS